MSRTIERKEGKRDALCLFSRKKRDQERREREEAEMHSCRNYARKFYQKVKRLDESYKPGASFCKDKHGDFLTDPQRVLIVMMIPIPPLET